MGACWSCADSEGERERHISQRHVLSVINIGVIDPYTPQRSAANTFANSQVSRGIPRSCYGEYKCQQCGRFWQSTLSWYGEYQVCGRCRKNVYPTNQREVRQSDIKQTGAEHPKELCQKCNSLGYFCGNYNKNVSKRAVTPRNRGKSCDRY